MRKISYELSERFSNTDFEEQIKILSDARDLLLYLDVKYRDDKETFFIGSQILENTIFALKEKKLELFKMFLEDNPEIIPLWQDFLEKDGEWSESFSEETTDLFTVEQILED